MASLRRLGAVDEPDQWTVDRVQGDIRTDLGSAPAFQFWGVAPGATTNSLLLGGDINEGAVYEATMHHEMPPTFRRLAGTHPGGTSSLTHVVGVIRRPAPEVSTKVVLRSFHPADWIGSFGRIFASEDAVHFANLGQHPEGWSPKSISRSDRPQARFFRRLGLPIQSKMRDFGHCRDGV